MKKQSRTVVSRKTITRGTKSSKIQRYSMAGLANAKEQYVVAMRKLAKIDKEEIRSITAITERLSKAQ